MSISVEEGLGLNRTSVGLKLRLRQLVFAPENRLNRTSVGLKRMFLTQVGVKPRGGLNRTSVGLKPKVTAISGRQLTLASIEPAWD